MSMSQEEIEALMSAGDDEITQDSAETEETQADADLDALLNEVIEDGNKHEDPPEDIGEIISGIDGIVEDDENKIDTTQDDDTNEQQVDITDENKDEENEENEENEEFEIPADILQEIEDKQDEQEAIPKEEIEKEIDEGIYPLPVREEHKVVTQLNKVAQDSEQKASQIFDVLSFVLDENDVIQKHYNEIKEFIQEQIELLTKLTEKFPKIDVFNSNLQKAQEALKKFEDLDSFINEENTKVFEAMELMQFHDINRQKIERVMTVIKKLATYLNQLFEDDSSRPEVKIAKHIDGDSNEVVTEEDLDALINSFSQEEKEN